jgi:putative flippase GtrA
MPERKSAFMRFISPILDRLIEFASHYKIGRMILKILTREMVAYLICGFLTSIIGIGVYILCYDRLHMEVGPSNTISAVLAVIFAFFVNKKFVFLSNDWSIRHVLIELGSFSLGRLATFIGETGLLILLVEMMDLNNTLCKIFTSVLVVIANYIVSKLIIFRNVKKKPEPAKDAVDGAVIEPANDPVK